MSSSFHSRRQCYALLLRDGALDGGHELEPHELVAEVLVGERFREHALLVLEHAHHQVAGNACVQRGVVLVGHDVHVAALHVGEGRMGCATVDIGACVTPEAGRATARWSRPSGVSQRTGGSVPCETPGLGRRASHRPE